MLLSVSRHRSTTSACSAVRPSSVPCLRLNAAKRYWHMIMCSSCAASDSNHQTSSRWATATLGSIMLCLRRRRIDPPNPAVYDDAVRQQRIRCWTAQHGPGANIELRPVQRTCDCCAIELALAKWASTMRARGLGGTEIPVHVEDDDITNERSRSGRDIAHLKLIETERPRSDTAHFSHLSPFLVSSRQERLTWPSRAAVPTRAVSARAGYERDVSDSPTPLFRRAC